jgi:hypothetical protein
MRLALHFIYQWLARVQTNSDGVSSTNNVTTDAESSWRAIVSVELVADCSMTPNA